MRNIFILAVAIISFCTAQSQSNINAGGHDKKEGNLTVSYSIGQTFTQSFTTFGGLISSTPGIQQTYNSSILSTMESRGSETGKILLFPNPAFDHFNISISEIVLHKAELRLFDLYGKVLAIHPLESPQTTIELTDYPSGIYVVRIRNANEEIKFFKVVKNQL